MKKFLTYTWCYSHSKLSLNAPECIILGLELEKVSLAGGRSTPLPHPPRLGPSTKKPMATALPKSICTLEFMYLAADAMLLILV